MMGFLRSHLILFNTKIAQRCEFKVSKKIDDWRKIFSGFVAPHRGIRV